jgi:hypothetical protein
MQHRAIILRIVQRAGSGMALSFFALYLTRPSALAPAPLQDSSHRYWRGSISNVFLYSASFYPAVWIRGLNLDSSSSILSGRGVSRLVDLLIRSRDCILWLSDSIQQHFRGGYARPGCFPAAALKTGEPFRIVEMSRNCSITFRRN